MSGSVVHDPRAAGEKNRHHECSPGVFDRNGIMDDQTHMMAKGTIWQCECGKTWVLPVHGTEFLNRGGSMGRPCWRDWRPETRRERRRRDRQMRFRAPLLQSKVGNGSKGDLFPLVISSEPIGTPAPGTPPPPPPPPGHDSGSRWP